MDVSVSQRSTADYKSPKHAQIWFLFNSRRRWKQKYMQIKKAFTQMRDREADTANSRGNWREKAREQQQRARKLEAENAQLQDQLERLKKIGTGRRNTGL
jgi:DNA-binding transcriptional MerR regulator